MTVELTMLTWVACVALLVEFHPISMLKDLRLHQILRFGILEDVANYSIPLPIEYAAAKIENDIHRYDSLSYWASAI